MQEIGQECLECQECDKGVFHERPCCLVYRKTMWLLSPCYGTMLQATLLKMKSNSNKQTTFSSPKATVIQKLPAFNLINPFYHQHHILPIQSHPSHTNPNPNIHPSSGPYPKTTESRNSWPATNISFPSPHSHSQLSNRPPI